MRQTLAGYRDFLARYASVFKAVWSVRAQLDPPARTADELAFLPAHLELTETPVSPKPRMGMRLIIALVAVALLWATIGRLDIVAVADGKTVPGSRTKVIQPLEAAVVRAIHVTDGQRVDAGDVLIELDSSGTSADARKATQALSSADGNRARYQAELEALDHGRAPKPFRFEPATDAAIETENRLAQSEFRAYAAKRESLGNQLAQREAELATTRELITHLTEAAKIAQARSKDLQPLLDKQYVSRHDFLASEQNRVQSERDLAQQQSRVHELESAISVVREERAAVMAEFRRQVIDGLRQASDQASQLTQDASKTERRDQLMRITAPVAGTVQQLALHTVGGVVTPAQPLLAIVPEDEVLEVEARILNRDIGFVREGQDAVIKVESFPYTRYGYLTGKVLSVSHDAMQDEKLGLVFQARVALARAALDIDGATVRLSPGMTLSVEIKTGTRRVIDYLLSPLRKGATEAMRER